MVPVFHPQTREHVGWEAICHHPDHQFPIKCRKNARNCAGGRSEPVTRRMLQRWLQLGLECSDKSAHMSIWKQVCEEATNNSLAEEVAPVTSFGARAASAPKAKAKGRARG